jgi:glutamine synthetase
VKQFKTTVEKRNENNKRNVRFCVYTRNDFDKGDRDSSNDSKTKTTQTSHFPVSFPIVMAALLAAVDEYGELMRMSIASPRNYFRLGAWEAPPAIIATYLGDYMTNYLEDVMNGADAHYQPGVKTIDLGAREVVPFKVPADDRNCISPFPYGGARFEFHAVGLTQNMSMVNTVLNTIAAEKVMEFSDGIEAGEDPSAVARKALKKHWRVIFNGNNYNKENQQMLTDRGIWCIE